MEPTAPQQHASTLLVEMLENTDAQSLSIGDIMHTLSDRAFGLVILLFSLPNCLPAPPGIGSIMGLPLIFFGLQLAVGRAEPWLPGFILERRIERQTLLKIVLGLKPWLERLEKICRPRWSSLTEGAAERGIGLLVALMGFCIALPIPFTNFIPAYGAAIVSLGLFEEDGLTVALGILVGLGGFLLVVGLIAAGLFAGVQLTGG